ncbi:universal stress protein [Azohydromonas lata]|uniref:Universal stress protein n=1 Tax=Azohydromonas lata TaxID=45677 RepID=A0ABU5ICV7_9BURK|nr:universal stress protein [Azohydromonas lata]MDZ5456787.1 universal stress protein [Azohydromonas lata]
MLVAVDDSDCTKRMLAHLVSHERWCGKDVAWTVFHAVPPLPHRAAALADPASVEDYYASDAERVLRPVRSFLKRHGIQPTFVHKICPPAREIARLANTGKFDVAVMGSQGRGAVGGAVLGSVVQQVLASTRLPVLIIR